MLTRMTRMARMLTHMLTRMTRWLAYYTHSFCVCIHQLFFLYKAKVPQK